MQKILKSTISLLFLAILLIFVGFYPQNTFSSALTESKSATVIVSRSNLYSADNFISSKVSYQEGESTILVVVKHGEEVYIEHFTGEFAYVSTKEGHKGYIYKYYLTQNSSQIVYPVFNASVRKNTIIYDIDKMETDKIAQKDSRVYIYEGFDDKKELTAIQIVLDDQTLYNGYIKTEDIAPDGVSGLLIIAISIIIAGVTIILSLVYIKKNKKSKKRKGKLKEISN